MKKLSFDQRRALAEFFANLAVVWLAAGVVTPFVAGKMSFGTAAMSLFWTGVLLRLMLYLTRGGKR